MTARTKVLVVQLGHCYRTSGATGTDGEQAFATRVGQACVRLINGRTDPTGAVWRVRLVLADDHDPDHLRGEVMAAIHADGSTNRNARGSSVGYQHPHGQAFGQSWKRHYQARGWTGGFRQDNYTGALANYYGVREAIAAGTLAAIIIEAGFLTNPADRALLTAGPPLDGAERVALALRDAVGIPDGQDAPEGVREDDSMRFVRGNAARPWSDFVFRMWWREDGVLVRDHVPDPNNPGYLVSVLTGLGMDPQVNGPWVIDQRTVDRVPFVSKEAMAAFKVAADKHVADFKAGRV